MADPKPKLNNAQQLAKIAAKVRKTKEADTVVAITTVYPQLKAKAETAARRGEVNMQIDAVTEPTLYAACNSMAGLAKLKEEGFVVNVTQLNGRWVLDIYWDSGDPTRQTEDDT